VAKHAPPGYDCPFFRLVAGGETERSGPADVVLRVNGTTAFVAAKWWPRNPGHVLVVPDAHHETIYEVPDELLGAVYVTAKRIARALRLAYGCEGTSTRQHNEPGGGQDVWHFHVHVFPRYVGDDRYARHTEGRWVDAAERAPYASLLRERLNTESEAGRV
jgi:histidine triad (HIT) family protein